MAAQKELNAIVAKSRELGYRGIELDARLALAEIEMKEGQTAAGRAQLAAVESDATAEFSLPLMKLLQGRKFGFSFGRSLIDCDGKIPANRVGIHDCHHVHRAALAP
jgi:hypothetical protein